MRDQKVIDRGEGRPSSPFVDVVRLCATTWPTATLQELCAILQEEVRRRLAALAEKKED